MDHIEISEATAQPGLGVLPSHKISITHGSNTYIYWYVKNKHDSRDFDKKKDNRLIKLMHSKGIEMKLGGFESFNIGSGKDYHLERKGSHEFIIKSLN
jgi:hypothetical protein